MEHYIFDKKKVLKNLVTDPSRIRIKMKRIRNTGCVTVLWVGGPDEGAAAHLLPQEEETTKANKQNYHL